MRSFTFAVVIGAASAITTHDFDYLSYMAQFNKEVADVEEFTLRAQNFRNTHSFVEEHNSSNATWVAGHNQFSDWTAEEIKSMLGNKASPLNVDTAPTQTFMTDDLPAYVNWWFDGAVNKVQDQGKCGSCWAFSATGALEAAHYLMLEGHEPEILKFSEQQLVDCADEAWGNQGCDGGLQENAFKYLQQNRLMLEQAYFYVSGDTQVAGSCQYKAKEATLIKVSDFVHVAPNDVMQMKAAVAQQPVAIAIEADTQSFLTYKSGVFNSTDCGTQLDHAVLAVGYGTEKGQDYWLVKNSWNTTWGEKGYIRIAIVPGEGICGIQMDPLFPHVTM